MKLLTLIRSYFKRQLPVGMAEFHEWSERIISLGGQYADPDSMKFALASALIHMDAKVSKVADQYFVGLLRKAAANQVASQFFQDIKAKQAEAQKLAAEAAQKLAEATATITAEVSNEQPKQS